MKKRIFLTVCVLCVVFSATSLHAQDLEDFVSKYTSENGQGYMQPLADAFGANLNSGWYHSARIPKTGFHIKVGLETVIALIGNKQKTFTATTESPFYPTTTAEVPTIFGSTQVISVEGQAGTVYNFPGGFDIKILPIAVPQLTVGALFGTEASVRYFDMKISDDLGKLSLFGFGLRHSISQYLPVVPVDLAGGFFYQSFKLGDIVNASALLIGVQGSKSFSLLTLYGGLGYESANLDIAYTYDADDEREEIGFDLSGANSVRLTVGFSLQLLILNLHAGYTLASQSVVGVGLGFGI